MAKFRQGDKVVCIADCEAGKVGDQFTVDNYLDGYDFVALKGSGHGYLNGCKFVPATPANVALFTPKSEAA